MTVNEILIDFGKKIVGELKDNLKTRGYKGGPINASGDLQSSIRFKTKVLGNEFVFQLSMKDYYEAVDEGRKPSSGGGDGDVYRNILKWVQTKKGLQTKIGSLSKSNRAGIKGLSSLNVSATKSLAYLIARKIHKKGTKATHFFSDVYNDEALLELKNNLSKSLKREVTIELTQA